mmetsp:Transcript_33060/g.65559  ORF Transcript_33060/g.65559 Transcript_33060/m.65559 type:complete len:269 (+) Transcript_33060:190-996(+)
MRKTNSSHLPVYSRGRSEERQASRNRPQFPGGFNLRRLIGPAVGLLPSIYGRGRKKSDSDLDDEELVRVEEARGFLKKSDKEKRRDSGRRDSGQFKVFNFVTHKPISMAAREWNSGDKNGLRLRNQSDAGTVASFAHDARPSMVDATPTPHIRATGRSFSVAPKENACLDFCAYCCVFMSVSAFFILSIFGILLLSKSPVEGVPERKRWYAGMACFGALVLYAVVFFLCLTHFKRKRMRALMQQREMVEMSSLLGNDDRSRPSRMPSL